MYTYKREAKGDLIHMQKRKQCEEAPKRVRVAGLENWKDVAMIQGMLAATRSLKR